MKGTAYISSIEQYQVTCIAMSTGTAVNTFKLKYDQFVKEIMTQKATTIYER